MKKLCILIIAIVNFAGLFSQNSFEKKQGEVPIDLPQEEVYVHYNSPLLFSGETLYYKFYSRNSLSGELSNLSKIGYLDLVDEEKQVVFKHAINLEKGAGQGDFFLPVSIPSGNYTLVGYTRWMTNENSRFFFEGDLVIINPYQRVPKNMVQILDSMASERPAGSGASTNNSLPIIQRSSKNFQLFLDGKEKDKRSKVGLKVQRQGPSTGTFSLSVRKKDNFPEVLQPNSKSYSTSAGKGARSLTATSITNLPDLRGQLISGRIIPNDTEGKVGLVDKSIGVSIPGETFFLRIVSTDEDGRFSFNLEQPKETEVYFQVLGSEKDKFRIIIDAVPSVDYNALQFPDFKITPGMEEMIRERSIYNQVENSYFEAKRDSLLPVREQKPFFGDLAEIYYLDDYTRFPTMQETFVEIIKFARIRRNRSGEYTFDLTLLDKPGNLSNLYPLVIVDGMLVQDHSNLVEYDARKIKSIGLMREKYFLGPEVYQGIFNVETIEGDFYESLKKDYLEGTNILTPHRKKQYYFPFYEGGQNNRIPDYRIQLYWEPDLTINSEETQIEFFTSDVAGEYEVILEGFTSTGEPVSLKENFTVR